MKVVIAPDSFKGSLSARDLCAAMHRGIKRVVPDAEVMEMPLADGGEGTMENMVYATQGTVVALQVRGPLGQPVTASYGVLGDRRTCIIEMAQASGLLLVPEQDRNPLLTSTYGTGELIRHALDQGLREFVIGLGGSATNDAGTGMLRALGMELFDQAGHPLPEGGGALLQCAQIDASQLDARIRESRFVIASDVTNPLCGPHGASYIFGPQKGATPEMVTQLDAALDHFGGLVLKETGREIRHLPGAGAAGGMGAALLAFLDSQMRSGIDVVMETLQLSEALQNADLVITGEGRLDAQTLSGKVIAGVCRIAQSENIPVIGLCGATELSGTQLEQLGMRAAFSIVPGPCSVEEAMRMTAQWAEERTEQIIRLLTTHR